MFVSNDSCGCDTNCEYLQEITSSRQRFPKPIAMYKSLLFYGSNVVASEAEQWKRYRKICGPSFSEPNNRLVWDETVSIMNDLFDNIWGSKKQIVSEHALEITKPVCTISLVFTQFESNDRMKLQLALFVIGAAGFGRRMSWNEEFAPTAKGQLSFKVRLAFRT